MMTLPPSSHHHHRPHPALQPAPPSSLVIATAIVRRLVREKSSYVIELAGQEARLADLLLKTKREKGEKEEGGGNEDVHDENWGYRVKQEVLFWRAGGRKGDICTAERIELTVYVGEGVGRDASGVCTADGEDSDGGGEVGGYVGTSFFFFFFSLFKHRLRGFSWGYVFVFGKRSVGLRKSSVFELKKGVLNGGAFIAVLTFHGVLFLQNFETWKDEKEVQAAKDMVATAKQHMANDLASMPDGQSQGLESCERKEGVVGRGKSISMNYDF